MFGRNESEIYGFFMGAVLQAEIDAIIKSKENKIIIAGKRQIKNAMVSLLGALCSKKIICISDKTAETAPTYPDDDFTDITPHYLRHTFATVGVNAGVPLKSMQALLGHADTKTLLDTYMHICYEDKRSSIKMIENNTSVKSLPAVDDTLSEKELNNKWSNVKRFKGTENYRNELLHRWE